MKRMTDKDLRLYARLSDIDSDLILDSAVTAAPAPVKARGRRMETVWRVFSNPMVASLAMSTVMITLLLVVLLATGAFKTPTTTEPPAHGSYPVETCPPLLSGAPTAEDAASLRKGMSLDELESLMGSDYTVDGDCYTFTLDTGEKLTVSLAPDTSLVSGFAWLGETAKTVNPMNIPEDILQKIQEYASDKVVPVYTMDSLFAKYNRRDLPTVDEVLEGTEIRYLRMSADGESVVLDEEGHRAGGAPETVDFDWLTHVSALFDESVKVKEYYPILTSAEGGSVYFRTSIGDYVLYLYGDPEPLNPSQLTDTVSYLVPVVTFHNFAYTVMSDNSSINVSYFLLWKLAEQRLDMIASYKLVAEGYQKPINLATPEAVERLQGIQSMQYGELIKQLGSCHHCARFSSIHSLVDGDVPYINIQESSGIHYWELTDGRCFIVYSQMGTTSPPQYSTGMIVYTVSDMMILDSAAIVNTFGTPSLELSELICQDMNFNLACSLMGPPTLRDENNNSTWKWMENGEVQILAITSTKRAYMDPYTTIWHISSMEYSAQSITEAAEEIKTGIPYSAIVARLGGCLCGHEVNDLGETSEIGYHYWNLPDGRCLAVYMGYDIPAEDSLYGYTVSGPHYGMTSMQILWLNSCDQIETIGVPSLSMAEQVQTSMKEEVVISLMGKPISTADSLFSAWEWSEGGKTYIYTVYWKTIVADGMYENFDIVSHYDLSEGRLSTLPISDQSPTSTDAAKVTKGMTASELLRNMGGCAISSTYLDATLYIWSLADGRVFCALAEEDVTDTNQTERVVTYTFYRDSVEDVSTLTEKNMEAVTKGMSMATVYALLGKALEESWLYGNLPNSRWGIIRVTWEIIIHPETNMERAYVDSVTIYK